MNIKNKFRDCLKEKAKFFKLKLKIYFMKIRDKNKYENDAKIFLSK